MPGLLPVRRPGHQHRPGAGHLALAQFAPAPVEAGYRSSTHSRLRHTSIVIGALNLFSSTVGRFDAQDVKIIQSLADVATIGVLQQRAVAQGEILTEQLQTALESRVTIEQAKGALARIRNVSVDEAFTLMRDHARRNHLPSPNSPAASSPTRPATPN